jgi:hypothetical protein
MSRLQLSINVSDLGAAVAFYAWLPGAQSAKLRAGYANFAIDDPPLKLVLSSPGTGPGGTINHLGVARSSRAGRRASSVGRTPAWMSSRTTREPTFPVGVVTTTFTNLAYHQAPTIQPDQAR